MISPGAEQPKFLADNDLNLDIVRGLRRRHPGVDFLTSAEAGTSRLSDPLLLAEAARLQRLLVTHDRHTMPGHFADFVESGRISPGVLIVSKRATIARIIEDLALIWYTSHPHEWFSRIADIPLR